MKFLKELLLKHLTTFILIGIVAVLWGKGCFNTGKQEPPKIVTVRDTVYIIHDSVVYSKPQIINNLPAKQKDIPVVMLPDTNYFKLKAQYEDLLAKYYSTNIQSDSLKIDTLGVVKVTDSVTQNKINNRKWDYNIKERIINTTTTITQPEIRRNQVYIGGRLDMSTQDLITQANAQILLKNKHNEIFGVSFGYNFPTRSQVIGIQYNKIISFRRGP